jgi:hypothetical protein
MTKLLKNSEPDLNSVRLGTIFTDEEIVQAWELFKCCTAATVTNRLVEEFIQPRMERINNTLGQPNDPRYIAYVMQYVFMTARAHHT